MPDLDEPFNGPSLDLSTWLPHYLPAWSSRAASVATWAVADSCLTLSIPPEQDLWCGDDHRPPLRVVDMAQDLVVDDVWSTGSVNEVGR